MKRSTKLRLTKELKLLLFTFGTLILLYFALSAHYSVLHIQAQLQQQQQQQQQQQHLHCKRMDCI